MRKALLKKEECKWKEIEASLISSIPNAGSREATTMEAVVRAVGGDSVLDGSFARERVSNIARRIRSTQLSQRALQRRRSWLSGEKMSQRASFFFHSGRVQFTQVNVGGHSS